MQATRQNLNASNSGVADGEALAPSSAPRRSRNLGYIALLLLLGAAGYLRFEGLGVRSLWHDEICTWYVSRMPLGDSLKWVPELPQSPLYQFTLRALTNDPHPSESMLRWPAAFCGLGIVLTGWWLGRMSGSLGVGLALVGLLAFQPLQIHYSQEARPYSMLVLGAMLTTGLWYRFVRTSANRYLIAYVVVMVLSLYAHYLTVLTMMSHLAWWLIVSHKKRDPKTWLKPMLAMGIPAMLCVPLAIRYLTYRTSMFQGLGWIKPPTFVDGLMTLSRLTYHWQWVMLLLPIAITLWMLACMQRRSPEKSSVRKFSEGSDDLGGLMVCWLFFTWFGLLLISWMAHPAMVDRYALPSTVPALFIPLLIAHRVNARAPMAMMLIFVLSVLPQLSQRDYDPGLREMTSYLQQTADPQHDLVVFTMDPSIYPAWENSERLVFDYYPLKDISVSKLRMYPDGLSAASDVLNDPRRLYLIVLWADPFPILQAAQRKPEDFIINGHAFSQLSFPPYRLVKVAPM